MRSYSLINLAILICSLAFAAASMAVPADFGFQPQLVTDYGQDPGGGEVAMGSDGNDNFVETTTTALPGYRPAGTVDLTPWRRPALRTVAVTSENEGGVAIKASIIRPPT